MTRDPELEAYFREAASWDADRAAQAVRSARVAWFVASAGWLCAVTSALAIMLLTPLKTISPFVIRVDNTTGLVDVVPIYDGRSPLPETVTRYLLKHYIDVCERFNFATAESDYEECGSFHAAKRNQEWSTLWATSSPSSPLNLYKDGSTVRPRVTSISFFSRANGITDIAQVRYIKGRRNGDGGEEQLTHWVATIQYAYVEPSKDALSRQINPLGFRIVDFKSEQETLPDGPSTHSTLQTAAAVPHGHTP